MKRFITLSIQLILILFFDLLGNVIRFKESAIHENFS